MALSDAEREKDKKRDKNRPIDAGSNFRWSDKQKLEAVHSYLALGNLALTSRVLGIPEITLRVWKASEWWKNVVEEAKVQERVELSNRMKKLIDAAQIIVANRLEHGDPVMSPKGEIVYKPVSLKDAHAVAKDLIDRKDMVEKGTSSTEIVTDEGTTGRLEKLAEKFAAMTLATIEKKQNDRRTVDAEDVMPRQEGTDAIHDERETRLQEGVREISFSSGTNQKSNGEDDGPSEG